MSMSQNTSHCKWELQHPSQQFRAIWETRKSRLPVVHLIMNDTEKGFWILYGLSSPCVIDTSACLENVHHDAPFHRIGIVPTPSSVHSTELFVPTTPSTWYTWKSYYPFCG